MSQIDNKKYTYISVLSFKKFDRSCDSIISYTFQFTYFPIQEVYRSRSRSGDMAKGHHLSENLSTTLTNTHPNAIDRCPLKGLCSSKNNFRSTQFLGV